MKTSLIALSVSALMGCIATQAQASVFSGAEPVYRAERPEKPEKPQKPEKVGAIDGAVQLVRAERPEKPEKPEKKEKLGAIDGIFQVAREAGERPRGADHERPGDRQRRGGRNA